MSPSVSAQLSNCTHPPPGFHAGREESCGGASPPIMLGVDTERGFVQYFERGLRESWFHLRIGYQVVLSQLGTSAVLGWALLIVFF